MNATELSIEKAKVGPLLERYQDGDFRTVPDANGDVKRVAICGLDNSHNGDYKVAYASDPLLVITTGDTDMTHDELQQLLETHGLWNDRFIPIEIPAKDGGQYTYRVGFKSLPEQTYLFDRLQDRLKQAVEREMDYLEGPNGASAYVPTSA